jgi:hypothetical protein
MHYTVVGFKMKPSLPEHTIQQLVSNLQNNGDTASRAVWFEHAAESPSLLRK